MPGQCRVQRLVRCVVDAVKTDKNCNYCIVGRVRKYDEMLSCDINLHKTKYHPTLQSNIGIERFQDGSTAVGNVNIRAGADVLQTRRQ